MLISQHLLQKMINHKSHLNRGFTIIELLVVIAIVSLLSSIMFASLSVARAKGRDARKQQDALQVRNALALYLDTNRSVPPNYNSSNIAFDDPNDSNDAYDQSMQHLVNAGYIKAIPHSPGGQPYGYYDYGAGSEQGAMFMTRLENSPGVRSSCPAFVLYTGGASYEEDFQPELNPEFPQTAQEYYDTMCLGGGFVPLSCSGFTPVCGPGEYCTCTAY